MPVIADYHLHTCHSGDSEAPMEAQVLTGISRGLRYMCFTDHYDPFFPYEHMADLAPGTFELDYPSYRSGFLQMKEKYSGRIDLRFGVELGLQAHLKDFLSQYVSARPELDFIIGSNHLCGGYDPYYPVFLKGRTEEEALALYLQETLDNILAFSDFDALGHLDYVVRYLPHRDSLYSYAAFSDLIDPILTELVNRGIALEVNTAPLAKGMRYFNPLPDILVRYREMGGELITIGSDAHSPDRIAAGFDTAAGILSDIGFKYYAVYKNRKPQMLSF